jgi:chorismate lyase/3-hydroxybenzoate synthase
MNAFVRPQRAVCPLAPAYVAADDPRELLGPDTLALFGFGDAAPRTLDDPRYVHVALQPLRSPAPFEVWRSDTPVQPWRTGRLAGADSASLSFGWVEWPEGEDGIATAAEAAYRAVAAHLAQGTMPNLLRVWNYLDAITEGEGDAERYRQFCVGRACGLQAYARPYPAATAIGRHDGRRVLQVYWLSARDPGLALENPRQVPAWDYPRQYGPRPPSFARAMLAPSLPGLPLMLSGTAAVVGHASHHPDDVDAQFEESLRNVDALLDRARVHAPALPDRFGAGSLLKAYVRREADLGRVASRLAEAGGGAAPSLVLHADVCRRELLVEIDGFHAP